MSATDPVNIEDQWSVTQAQQGDEEEEEDRSVDDGEQDRRAVGPRPSDGDQTSLQGFPSGTGVTVSIEGHDVSSGAAGGRGEDDSSTGGAVSEELLDVAGLDDDDSSGDGGGASADYGNDHYNDQSDVQVEALEDTSDHSYDDSARPARDDDTGSVDRMPSGTATGAAAAAAVQDHTEATWEEGFDVDAALPSAGNGEWQQSENGSDGEGGVREGGDGRDFIPREGVSRETPDRSFNSMSFRDDVSPLAPSDIMRHIPTVAGRDREAQAVIDALEEVYRDKLRPIEKLSMFDKFHHDVMADAELQAKPQVLVLGQYSTGKTSMIRHLIGRDFPAMHIGPEPSGGVFQVVMAGTEERTIKGSALCIVDELPYVGLGKFGAPFLSKLQASILPSPLLDHINFIDTPGVTAGEKHGDRQRRYPFAEVVKWCADRSDLILLVFDAHKLDMGQEFREVIDAIAHHGDRVRVVLNKAQEVDSDRLVKVYGALMWSIGRCLRGRTGAPKVYVGSFWNGPRRHPDTSHEEDDGFDKDEAALRREINDLPKNVGVRKIDDMMQRARLVKIHLQIVYAVQARMPRLWGSEAAQERILGSLEEVFREVKEKEKINDADMPDVEDYRRDLGRVDFRNLPRRSRRLLATMDDIIERDIKQCVTRAGGVRRIYKLNSAASITEGLPTPGGRRATVGGGSALRSSRGLGVGLFSRQSSSGAVGRHSSGHDQDWESKCSESSTIDGGDDAQRGGLLLATGGVGEGGEMGLGDKDVSFLAGTIVLVLVVLAGISVGLWKMDALPALPEWALALKPGPPQ